ncbi:hypothetical protein BDBG_07856 [Blastomyces gilchristii SLH14081]|uniref:BTB domain-containing protein n=1 Tax=Blastomyces gilchristii (strain SLH14081) TaxID=559298 RepID=A0A179UWQ2_BLAGS|nr:uncharacterized protein BDBG_07856 [Blastomyces gilchristii SLH14081]OAT12526.1 hypothetical protein BDBG_07856 [Blastomyces gilchristii SLH14081]
MKGAFERYLSSPLFIFTIEANKNKVAVHSSALARLSQSLNTLINSEMKEAKTGHAVWLEDEPPEPIPESESESESELEPELKAISDEPSELESSSEDDACNDPEIPYKKRSIWSEYLYYEFVESLIVLSLQSKNLGCTFTLSENTRL